MPFHDEFVAVVGFGGVERLERKVVEDQQVDAGEPAEFGVTLEMTGTGLLIL